MKSLPLIVFLFFISTTITAQQKWTLENCFQYAMEHNISVKQIELSQQYAENALRQSKMNIYLPNINASITESFNFGNSIDPTSYQFVNSNTNSTQFGIGLNYNLFEGFARINSIKANQENLSASDYEIEALKNKTKIAISNLYLQIMIAKELLSLAQQNKQLNYNQYQNSKELVSAGVLANGALLDLDAQLAQNDLEIIKAENALEKAINQLKLVLQLDPYESFDIADITFETTMDIVNTNPKNISNKAHSILPEVKAIENRLTAAEYDLKQAKGRLFPTLSLNAQVGTNYFSAAQEIKSTSVLENKIPVIIDGSTSILDLPDTEQPIFGNKSFGTQLKDNLSESVSLSLSIPILAAWQRRSAISNAKLNIIKAELDIANTKQQLNEEIFNAYTDLRLASKRYQATENSIKAANEAYKYANEKYKAGILNAFEFEQVKNRKLSAEAEQLQAKYEYFFRKFILKYYETGTLAF